MREMNQLGEELAKK